MHTPEQLHDEINGLLQELEESTTVPLAQSSFPDVATVARCGKLIAFSAKLADISSRRLEDQTNTLIRFTRVLVWLTWTLIAIGALQFVAMIVQMLCKS